MSVNEQIEDMFARGYSYLEIAERTGLSREAVAGRCYRRGLVRGTGQYKRLTHEQKTEIVRLARDGVKYADIAARVGCNAGFANQVALARGIRRQRQSENRA